MFVIGTDIRITVAGGSDDDPVYVFPPYIEPQMRAAIKRLAATRVEYTKNKPVDRGHERRLEFFDTMCSSAENFGVQQGDDVVPLQEAYPDNWREMIPPNHKTSCAAHFEERGTLTDEDRKN